MDLPNDLLAHHPASITRRDPRSAATGADPCRPGASRSKRLDWQRPIRRPAAGRQHHPRARHRRRAAGQQRSPRCPHGRRAHDLRPVDAVPEARPHPSRLVRPRPLRAQCRARQHAALRDAAPHRLRPAARRAAALPPARLTDAGPPGVRRHARRGGHHRTPRPGLQQCRGHGHRGATPGRRVRPPGPRHHRPSHLRALLGRRPPGGHHGRSGQPGRPPAPRQARRPLRRQRHPARRADAHGLVGGRPGPLRRLRLAHPARRRRQRPGCHRGRHRGRPG